MELTEIFKSHAAHVANIVIVRDGQRIGSGTGFIVKGRLVTCAHLMPFPPGANVEVHFEQPAAEQTPIWRYAAFGQPPQLLGHSDQHSYDYAIFEPPLGSQVSSGLQFAEAIPEVGEAVCTLGYPFENPHLTLHRGIVSAVYQSGVATMIKLDMSVNPSNSGGPLIRVSDGSVVGMVVRKATGLTKAFDNLRKSYVENINILQGMVGRVISANMDAAAVQLAVQQQMGIVSEEIFRSSNVGIGYAIFATPLRHEPALA